jgi:cytochrome c biogenesis protein CcmG/thiol:disulfide interchange protein DsbE
MKRPIAIVGTVVVLLLVALSALLITRHPAVEATKAPSPLLGHLAPEISGTPIVKDVASEVPQVTDLRHANGDVVVVNFWSSWCGPCRSEAPELSTFAWNERKDHVAVLGVLFNDSEPAAQSFSRYYGSLYPTVLDTGGVFANRYGVTSPPTTFIIDSKGRIAAELLGATTAAQLSAALKDVH